MHWNARGWFREEFILPNSTRPIPGDESYEDDASLGGEGGQTGLKHLPPDALIDHIDALGVLGLKDAPEVLRWVVDDSVASKRLEELDLKNANRLSNEIQLNFAIINLQVGYKTSLAKCEMEHDWSMADQIWLLAIGS